MEDYYLQSLSFNKYTSDSDDCIHFFQMDIPRSITHLQGMIKHICSETSETRLTNLTQELHTKHTTVTSRSQFKENEIQICVSLVDVLFRELSCVRGMRSGFYRTVLLRLSCFSRQVFGDESNVSGMRSIRCSSWTKRGNGRIQEPKKKTKNAVYIKQRKQTISKLVKPIVIKKEEEELGSQKLITELKRLPGVGQRNAELLSQKGLSVETLRSMFFEKFKEQDSSFVEYLQEEVGIRHRCHCQSIAGFLSNKNNSEYKNQTQNKRLTVSIEGNISAGKTSFLSYLSEQRYEIQDLCEFVREPVDMWQKVGGNEGNNLLQRFYADPERHAYEFQNYVFLTRLKQNRTTIEGNKPLRIMERSVFSDRIVFVRAVHEANWMDDMQLQLYDSWFNPFIRDVPGLIPDGFIYLRADPKTCLRRLEKRARIEEFPVSVEYLEQIHSKHEDWFGQNGGTETKSILFPQSAPPIDRISTRPNLSNFEVPLPSELEGCIMWLGTEKEGILSQTERSFKNNQTKMCYLPEEVKAAVHNVPALVLNYDQDFDVERDEEAKKHYVKKVKAYFDYVKLYRETRSHVLSTQDSDYLRMKWSLVDTHSREALHELKARGGRGIPLSPYKSELILPSN